MPYKLHLKPNIPTRRKLSRLEGISRSVWNWTIEFCRTCSKKGIQPTLDLVSNAFKHQYETRNSWITPLLTDRLIYSTCKLSYRNALSAFQKDRWASFHTKNDFNAFFFISPNDFLINGNSISIKGFDTPITIDMPFELEEVIIKSFLLKNRNRWYIILDTDSPNPEHLETLDKLEEIRNAEGLSFEAFTQKHAQYWELGAARKEERLPEIKRIHKQLKAYTNTNYRYRFSRKPGPSYADKHGITLDTSVLNYPIDKIAGTFSHEWAHCYFGHSYTVVTRVAQRNQERAADRFSAEFLAEHNYQIEPLYRYYLEAPDAGYPTHPSGRERARNLLLRYNEVKKNKETLQQLTSKDESKSISEEVKETKDTKLDIGHAPGNALVA